MLCCVALAGALAGPQPEAPDPAALARALADSLRLLGAAAVQPGDAAYALRAELARALGVPLAAPDAAPPLCPRWADQAPPGAPVGYTLSVGITREPPPAHAGPPGFQGGFSAGHAGGRRAWVAVAVRCAGPPGVPRGGHAAGWTYVLEPAGGEWRVAGRAGRRWAT